MMSFETVTNTMMQSFGLAYAVSVGVLRDDDALGSASSATSARSPPSH